MPSTLIHLALAALLAAALLGAAYDVRALAVVLGITAFADIDAFAPYVVDGGHRVLFHNLWIPLVAGAVLWYDLRLRERSWIRSRWGAYGSRVAGVAVLTFGVSAVGLDLVTNGVNLVWPLDDQFYVLDGKLVLSSTDGLVQTFVELPSGSESGGAPVPAPESVGSSENVTYNTGVDPAPPEGSEPVERIFPIARSGWELLLLGAGIAVTAVRLRMPDLE